MKVTAPQDCDNAPKKHIIKDFLVAFYQKKEQAWKAHLSDTVVLVQNGKIHNGLAEVESENKVLETPDHLQIEQILTHGKFCACHGQALHKHAHNGIAYFFDFKSAGSSLIQRITVYQIPLPAKDSKV